MQLAIEDYFSRRVSMGYDNKHHHEFGCIGHRLVSKKNTIISIITSTFPVYEQAETNSPFSTHCSSVQDDDLNYAATMTTPVATAACRRGRVLVLPHVATRRSWSGAGRGARKRYGRHVHISDNALERRKPAERNGKQERVLEGKDRTK